jgi:hypothetical protein
LPEEAYGIQMHSLPRQLMHSSCNLCKSNAGVRYRQNSSLCWNKEVCFGIEVGFHWWV